MATPEPEEDGVDLKIILKADLLQDMVDALHALVSEATFRFHEDLIRTWEIDPATVGGCYIDISPDHDDIQHYSVRSQGVVQGLPLADVTPNLNDLLDHADSDDLIQITWGEATKWKLNFQFPNVEVNLGGIDPDSMRESPDKPNLDLPYTYRTEGEKLKEVVDINDMFGGHNTIRVADHVAEYIAAGDTDDATYSLDEADGDLEFIEHGDDPVESMFSMDYQKSLAKVLKDYDEVVVTVGDEMPMFFETDLFTYMLAPRIPSN